MTEPRKKLSDILRADAGRETLSQLWTATAAAEERGPLPPGEYLFRVLSGELFTSKGRGTPGYKLSLEVCDGEYEGRRAWHDLWLTPAALPMTKRDLAKIGVQRPEQLELPLPPGILLKLKVSVRQDDDGRATNKVIRFECVGTEPGDAFEPKDATADDASFDPAQLDGEPDGRHDAAPPQSRKDADAEANGSHPEERP